MSAPNRAKVNAVAAPMPCAAPVTSATFPVRSTASGPNGILPPRLRKLEAQGIVERRLYNERPKRYSYHLTRPGMALGSVMLAMMSWGREYGDWRDREPLVWSHDCGAPVSVELHCRECGEPVARRMTAPPGHSAEDVEPAHL